MVSSGDVPQVRRAGGQEGYDNGTARKKLGLGLVRLDSTWHNLLTFQARCRAAAPRLPSRQGTGQQPNAMHDGKGEGRERAALGDIVQFKRVEVPDINLCENLSDLAIQIMEGDGGSMLLHFHGAMI